jgi:hypothetical protein
VVILDQWKGLYYTLDEVAARCWELIAAGSGRQELINQLALEYRAPLARLHNDVDITLSHFRRLHLVSHGRCRIRWQSPAVSSPALSQDQGFRQPTVFWCLILICWFKLLLSLSGFFGTLEWLRRCLTPLPATRSATVESVRRAERIVATAGAVFPGRAQCLEQTLVLYYLLRTRGVSVTYWQGVQLFPFQAHAWLTYGEEIVNDVPEHVRQFTPLPAQLP